MEFKNKVKKKKKKKKGNSRGQFSEKRVFTGYGMLSCTDHLGKKENSIKFGRRNMMFGLGNLNMLSFCLGYSQYFSYSFKPYFTP